MKNLKSRLTLAVCALFVGVSECGAEASRQVTDSVQVRTDYKIEKTAYKIKTISFELSGNEIISRFKKTNGCWTSMPKDGSKVFIDKLKDFISVNSIRCGAGKSFVHQTEYIEPRLILGFDSIDGWNVGTASFTIYDGVFSKISISLKGPINGLTATESDADNFGKRARELYGNPTSVKEHLNRSNLNSKPLSLIWENDNEILKIFLNKFEPVPIIVIELENKRAMGLIVSDQANLKKMQNK
jgi:hypothetical protein